jgi:hypothetical protein
MSKNLCFQFLKFETWLNLFQFETIQRLTNEFFKLSYLNQL